MTLRRARKYCRQLARRHYENFTVASFLLPRRLRQHFCHVYAYCRWADDLADENRRSAQSLALLGWWETQLRDCYRGRASHPVFVALAETIERFKIPAEPFIDLLVAFRQDQRRRALRDDRPASGVLPLFGQSGRSASAVSGRMLLGGAARLADSICTGLQLANFCQDVARDWDCGRIYLPLTDCQRFGYTEASFEKREPSEAFRRLLAAEVEQAAGFLHSGLPLVKSVPPELQLDIALFIQGGLAVLQAIRKQDFDVWTKRPTVTKMEKFRLLAQCWWRLKTGKQTAEPR